MMTFVENRPLGLYRGTGLIIAPCPKEKTETCYHVRLDPFYRDSYPVTVTDISGDPEFYRKHTTFDLDLPDIENATDE